MLYDLLRRVILIFLAFCLLVVLYFYFMIIYTLDGKTYSRTNFLDYYLLTPSILMDAPNISNEQEYFTQADDNYGYCRDEVTWKHVRDVYLAKEEIEVYMKENKIKKDTKNHSGTTYVLEVVGDEITLVIFDYN